MTQWVEVPAALTGVGFSEFMIEGEHGLLKVPSGLGMCTYLRAHMH